MKQTLIFFSMALLLISIVGAYPTYIDIHMTETVTENVSFAKNFDLTESTDYCRIVGIINISNPSNKTISDISLNFSNTDEMYSNFTLTSGRTGTQNGNKTPGAVWILHIPELRSNEESIWEYNLSCTSTDPPLDLNTSYETTISGITKKVLAGKNFTINQRAINQYPYAITNVNVSIYTQQVLWNQTEFNFSLLQLENEGDNDSVTNSGDSIHWWWEVNSGTIGVGQEYNITYVVKAPENVPTSNSYMAIKEYSSYQIPFLASNLTLDNVKAIGDIDLKETKEIVRPSDNQNNSNVTFRSTVNITVPFDIAYNITKVSVWVTHNLSPLATDTPFGTLNTQYNPGLTNQTNGWNSISNSWEFNYTDGSNPSQGGQPIIWVRPYYHLFSGGNQIISTNITQNGQDIYMKYIYVVYGYWLEVNKNITNIGTDQYNVTITVKNIGNAWTPQGMTVTVYDFIPTEFTPAEDWNPYSPNQNSSVEGVGFNGTSFQWDLGLKSPYNASLGPQSSGEDTWVTSYSVTGAGEYKVSELYIVGLDPRKVDGAGSHQGITVISELSYATKEAFYIVSVIALVILNIINFIMTKNIHKKLNKK